jgi:hypothetical protein
MNDRLNTKLSTNITQLHAPKVTQGLQCRCLTEPTWELRSGVGPILCCFLVQSQGDMMVRAMPSDDSVLGVPSAGVAHRHGIILSHRPRVLDASCWQLLKFWALTQYLWLHGRLDIPHVLCHPAIPWYGGRYSILLGSMCHITLLRNVTFFPCQISTMWRILDRPVTASACDFFLRQSRLRVSHLSAT